MTRVREMQAERDERSDEAKEAQHVATRPAQHGPRNTTSHILTQAFPSRDGMQTRGDG